MALLHTSLHGTYIPVTLFYLSTNLVDNFFHKLWQNLNYITRVSSSLFLKTSWKHPC